MNTTIHGHDLKATAVMALLALVLLSAVAFAAWPAITTSDSGSDPAMHATSAAGSSIARDPYIDDHAEVVASYQ
jgi:hypothetical protein